ncbi:MAG: tRNA lysidine(34) synthetase TilS [Acetobacteraceae bacterium]|nr:tRNA lysidine(34) synthetase TilS [Acetobacteraceae bacterium]
MSKFEPFEPRPRIAAAVSGGADSMALALLSDRWVRSRGGAVLAVVIDHALRPESGAEAAQTMHRLAVRGIQAKLLRVAGLTHGPALAERARAARYSLLHEACRTEGILHLLVGHHAADQAETVLLRRQSGSGPAGLAAMAAVVEHQGLRILRPLLNVSPAELRDLLWRQGVGWVEDPSNADLRATRPRLRAELATCKDPEQEIGALCAAARQAARVRAQREAELANLLADRAAIYPEGFAVLSPGAIDPDALGTLIQAISGAIFPPRLRAVAALASAPHPATCGGVRMAPAGRLGPGLLLVREEAAMASPIRAVPGQVWDGRFRLQRDARVPKDAQIGALGDHAANFRRLSHLPASVLRTLPALRVGNMLAAVPHLLYPDPESCSALRLDFHPQRAAAGAPFFPA